MTALAFSSTPLQPPFSVYIALKCSGCSDMYRIYFTVIFSLAMLHFFININRFLFLFSPLVLHSRVFHDRRASAASQSSAPVMQTQVQTILQNPPVVKLTR